MLYLARDEAAARASRAAVAFAYAFGENDRPIDMEDLVNHASWWSVLLLVAFVQTARPAAAQIPATEITTGTKISLAAGATLELRAVNGEASFLKAPGDQVVVEFARAAPADVKVVTLTTPSGVIICTVYASSDPKKPTECSADGKGRLAAGKVKDQSRVQFRIRVPPGVHVKATIDQGDLKCIGITGNLQFYSNNGYVLVHDAGGPGTIDAGVGLLGNVDAVIAKEQNGPGLRRVRLRTIGSGRYVSRCRPRSARATTSARSGPRRLTRCSASRRLRRPC